MKPAKLPPIPAVGQVWIDNDPRSFSQRRLRIVRIEGEYAYCDELWKGDEVFKKTRIKLRRLRPTANGYRLETP